MKAADELGFRCGDFFLGRAGQTDRARLGTEVQIATDPAPRDL
jgi:hypothetical protein